MLRHIVMITFKPDVTDAQKDAYRSAVMGFADNIPEIRSLVCGDNVGSGPNHHDFAIVADFDDMAAFRKYIDGPVHQGYVQDHARKVVEKLAAIQHEI